MTAGQISTAEVGQVPASASAYPDNDTRERSAAVITSASGGGKISSTNRAAGRVLVTLDRPEALIRSLTTGKDPGDMMPRAGRASLRTHISAVTPGGDR